MGMGGVYKEIVKNERVVNSEKFDEPWYPGEAVNTTTFDEAGVLEDFQMSRDRREADLERLGELEHRRIARRQTLHDRASRRIGEGGKRGVEGGSVGHLYLTCMLNTTASAERQGALC